MAPGSGSGAGRSAGHRRGGYIGAGDSFQAALLFALRAIGRIKRAALAEMNAGELDRALSFASACAAVTCSRAGADPPRQSDIGPALSRLFAG